MSSCADQPFARPHVGRHHAPVMAALMVFEMIGQYGLLPVLLPYCVVAALVSRRLRPRSDRGHGP